MSQSETNVRSHDTLLLFIFQSFTLKKLELTNHSLEGVYTKGNLLLGTYPPSIYLPLLASRTVYSIHYILCQRSKCCDEFNLEFVINDL